LGSESQSGTLDLHIGYQGYTDLWLHGLGQRVQYNISRKELNKLQKLPCLAITVVIKMTPAAAMEVLLELTPLYMMIEMEVQAKIYRQICTQ
jgi:hypothetical protein